MELVNESKIQNLYKFLGILKNEMHVDKLMENIKTIIVKETMLCGRLLYPTSIKFNRPIFLSFRASSISHGQRNLI